MTTSDRNGKNGHNGHGGNGNGHASSSILSSTVGLMNDAAEAMLPGAVDPFSEDVVMRLANEVFQELAPRTMEAAAAMMTPQAEMTKVATVIPNIANLSTPMAMPAVPEVPAMPAMPAMAMPAMPMGVPAMPIASSQPQMLFDTDLISRLAHELLGTTTSSTPAPGYSTVFHGGTPAMPGSMPAVGRTSAMPIPSSRPFDVDAIRRDFPVLQQMVHGKPLVWLDNAATTQKPQHVIDALSRFYEHDNSNVHRGAHQLAARATNEFEQAREKVQMFLNAASPKEIVWVRGTTEAINLVAQTYGRKNIGKGDEIVLTTLEHHSNIVPWQMLANEKGAVLRVVPVNDRGEIIMEEYERLLNPRTRIVAMTHVSNALGTVLPVRMMTEMAHRQGAKVLVDGAQGVPHFRADVQNIGADWYAFSGHKLFGPTGVGVLYGRKEILDEMPPWQGGGNMIDTVSFDRTTYAEVPAKFEAGTGVIGDAVGLGAAIDYLAQIGCPAIERHEHALMTYLMNSLATVPGLKLIGTAAEKAGVASFVLDGMRTDEVGKYLDSHGIAVRASHHCAQPALKRFGLTSSVRPSIAFYNTFEEIDLLTAALHKARHM